MTTPEPIYTSTERSGAAAHPAGLTAVASGVLVWAASQAGVEIPDDVAVGIVVLLTAAVSYFTPRR